MIINLVAKWINLAVDEVQASRVNLDGASALVVMKLSGQIASPGGHSPHTVDVTSVLTVI